jgi:type II secretion system protein J
MKNSGPYRLSKPTGMTLVEVLVALSIFAILSIMGYRALDAFQRQDSRLELRQQQLSELMTLINLLESDFSEAYQLVHAPAQIIQWKISPDRQEFILPKRSLHVEQVQRTVRWVIQDNVIRRYPDGSSLEYFREWSAIASGVNFFAVQGDKKRDWNQLDNSLFLQGVEFRLQLIGQAEISRSFAMPQRSPGS